jgi:hypothetical protein
VKLLDQLSDLGRPGLGYRQGIGDDYRTHIAPDIDGDEDGNRHENRDN